MARLSRPLKTAFWEDDKVCLMSRDARLTLVGLITKMADDEGRFNATANAVMGALYPNDKVTPASIKRWMSEIEDQGILLTYRINGGTYGQLIGWAKHQKPPHPSPSTIPEPPEGSS